MISVVVVYILREGNKTKSLEPQPDSSAIYRCGLVSSSPQALLLPLRKLVL